MKKITLLILLNIYFLLNVNSQILISLLLGDDLNSDKLEFGIETGVNFSSIGGLETTKYLKSWNIGFYFDLSLKENTPWNLYTGVLVKSGLGIDKLTGNDVNILSENTKGCRKTNTEFRDANTGIPKRSSCVEKGS